MSQELSHRFLLSQPKNFLFCYRLPTLNYSGNNILSPLSIISKYFSTKHGTDARFIKLPKNKQLNEAYNLKAFKEIISRRNENLDPDYEKTSLNRIRKLEIMARQDTSDKKKLSVDRQLKVMNYNVLAQDLIELHRSLYDNHTPENLSWENRSRLLMEQITSFLPDILTLQEVQESHIGPFYKQLEKFGYKGLFKRRTGERTDGCALYYMSSLMDLVEYKTVEYYRPQISPTLLNRPNVAIVARLRPRPSSTPRVLGRELIVANTHLLYNPRRDDVRVAQIQILLAEMHSITKNLESEQPAVLLMGDLNSWPNSPVIKLLGEGRIPSYQSHLPSGAGISNQCTYVTKSIKCKENFENNVINGGTCDRDSRPEDTFMKNEDSQLDISHSYDFKSVYDWRSSNNSALATTYQGRWVIVDYMFYSTNMQLISRLRLPTVEECEHVIGWIPNKASPSDHFPLAATFIVE